MYIDKQSISYYSLSLVLSFSFLFSILSQCRLLIDKKFDYFLRKCALPDMMSITHQDVHHIIPSQKFPVLIPALAILLPLQCGQPHFTGDTILHKPWRMFHLQVMDFAFSGPWLKDTIILGWPYALHGYQFPMTERDRQR